MKKTRIGDDPILCVRSEMLSMECFLVDLVVEAEKCHQKFVHGIEGFDKMALQHADTRVKVILPDNNSKLPWQLAWTVSHLMV